MNRPSRPPSRPPSQPLLERFPALGKVLGAAFALIAVAAIALAVVSVIGGGDESAAPPEDPATVAPPAGGGTLRLGVVGLASLDPLDAREPASVMVADQVFDTLVTYDPETSEPEPQLASWSVNPEQTVFTFRLREGAIFHDETPITAGDVKFTLERIAAKGSTSPLLAQLDAVAGFGAFHRDGTATGLSGLAVPDPATLVVTLERPFAPLVAALGHPGFGVVPRAAVEAAGATFKATPVGSGPFKVGTDVGGRLRLARFGGTTPVARLDRIDVVRFDDNEAAYAAYGDGELDIAPVPAAQVAEAAEAGGTRGMQPVGVLFYGLNVKSPDLADARFREAIGLAVDRGAILDQVYLDALDPATALVVDGVPGYVTDSCGSRCAHEPERARTLVGEAFPGGAVPEVTIDHDDDPAQVQVATLIEADLEAVGIPAVLRPHAFADYGTFIVSGSQEMFRYGWVGAYPSFDAYLAPLFSSTSPENLSGLSDPDVDAGLAAARAEPDPQTRAEIYKRVEQEVLSAYAVVLLAELETRMVVHKRVRAFSLNPLGSFDGATVTLAPK